MFEVISVNVKLLKDKFNVLKIHSFSNTSDSKRKVGSIILDTNLYQGK